MPKRSIFSLSSTPVEERVGERRRELKNTENSRQLRRQETPEAKQLWQALKAGRFAGFKFRREHPVKSYSLDFYCPLAKLTIELDGFHHGTPKQIQHDQTRKKLLEADGIEELRFWNHQWRKNREGVLLEIWNVLHRRTGCVMVDRKSENHRYIPPNIEELIEAPLPSPLPAQSRGEGKE